MEWATSAFHGRMVNMTDDLMDTLQRNRKAFSAHAQGFSSDGETYADEAGLAWMLTEHNHSVSGIAPWT